MNTHAKTPHAVVKNPILPSAHGLPKGKVRAKWAALTLTAVLCGLGSPLVRANPIPLPLPASMPREDMVFNIDRNLRVDFEGRFTFDYIPSDVTSMLFPLPPVDAAIGGVFQDSAPLPWSFSFETYPTVLAEYPRLTMFEWAGPFPVGGAVFTVEYEHGLFPRDDHWILFYSLGTGKYFPTYDKTTTASFSITFPPAYTVHEVLLDTTPLPPEWYTLTETSLELELESSFGPFTEDLVVVMDIPEPRAGPAAAAALLVLAGCRWVLKRSWKREGGDSSG
jgi:hypothetical protein